VGRQGDAAAVSFYPTKPLGAYGARGADGEALNDCVEVPRPGPEVRSAWAQYTLGVARRDRLAASLRSEGIPTAVYYPRPLNRQPAFRHFPSAPRGLPVAEALAETVLSLPIHPDLAEANQSRVVDAIRRVIGQKRLDPARE
jgi:dTDP-4-amino-4,6-dideoxygalactose transaminase